MFWHVVRLDALRVFTGVLPNLTGLVRIKHNIYIGDTLDGGLSTFMRKPGGEPARFWREYLERSEEFVDEWPAEPPKQMSPPESVPVRCVCEGVDFTLKRYDAAEHGVKAPPGLVHPKTLKHYASCDWCDSCRLDCGVDVMSWTFSPLTQLKDKNGAPLAEDGIKLRERIEKSDPGVGTLRAHKSRKDVLRFFCGTCSATVFFWADDEPGDVDIAIGLLRSETGARAEDFLIWELGKMSFAEDTKGGWREGLVKSVDEESLAWGKKKGYPTFRRGQPEGV